MVWNNEKTIEFIDNYEAEPVLWNPQDPGHKKKHLHYDAWLRIQNNLSWPASVDELKKKKDSLMAYYRVHHKKSLKSGTGADGDDVYKSNWFAYSALNRFLQPIYACDPLILTQIEDNTKANPEESSTSPKRPIVKRKIDVYYEKTQVRNQMKHLISNLDEYELFGKFISSKIRKMKDPDSRDILMNDIQNMVFQACITDRSTGIGYSDAFKPRLLQRVVVEQYGGGLNLISLINWPEYLNIA